MRIGYPCITRGLDGQQYKTCRKQNATEERLIELIGHNLNVLEQMIDYNHAKGIRMFRISSDIIPFGSDLEVNHLNWPKIFADTFSRIAKKIQAYALRVSMHPGQYTVLNSPKQDVIKRAVEDLRYHCLFLDSLEVGREGKLVLHIGGLYGDKEKAMERFVANYKELDQTIKDRLIIENDDRLFTIADVLSISEETGAPVVYDNLHHKLNGEKLNDSDAYWIEKAIQTWSSLDGRPKVHYAQQQKGARLGAHSLTIEIEPFLTYFKKIKDFDIDIMLEVKDKNLSAIKCILATSDKQETSELYKEWDCYKHLILERSPEIYSQITELLNNKDHYPVKRFYSLIEEAIQLPLDAGNLIEGLEYAWDCISQQATAKERETTKAYKQKLAKDTNELSKAKRYLKKLAVKYEADSLLSSYYFEL
ncbi:UV DNA damage endonuclease [Alkalibacterium sp. AK22]|uniref:UV DNA damage repair endonuclease UvsE n=1 Tax=Alkalibacterium sp. AK22 TaxID=1229520 RepID=UPI00044C21E5|nr:UV DNA damage repair endonuclease UvsE [Alkalibacterium sp. AK22]EXJ22947.1 UV DNA damage endonuclease [Alkalibacterium sp. AK22]